MLKIWSRKKEGSSSSSTEPAHKLEMERLKSENQSLTAKIEQLQVENDECRSERDQYCGLLQMLNKSNKQKTVYGFAEEELREATQNFNKRKQIGKGGYCSVYRGYLHNTTIAVKQYSDGQQGRAQFHQEATILAKVRHPNIVTLLGICEDALCLVCEFLPNGNLQDCLKKGALNWQIRTRILGDIYTALEYLHSHKPERIVHGDLKLENILVDANHVSKLIDFGISRFASPDGQVTAIYHTEHPARSIPYMDPEFLTTGDLIAKSDAYSFGIVILCVLTGRPPKYLANTVKRAIDDGTVASLVDKSVADWPEVQFKKWARLGVRLATVERHNRPRLAEVSEEIMPLVKSAKYALSRGAFPIHRT